MTPAAESSRPPVLALGGGAGAGKTTLASALVERVDGARVVHLDSCYRTDPAVAPSLPRFDGGGRVVDRSAPEAIDRELVVATLGEHLRAAPSLVVIEGMFALALPFLDEWVRWRAYLSTCPPTCGSPARRCGRWPRVATCRRSCAATSSVVVTRTDDSSGHRGTPPSW